MYISNELKKRRSELESEHKQFMVRMMAELNQRIIDYNTDLGKYFLIDHLIEKLSGNTETIELLRTMKYKESNSGGEVHKNEYEMTESSYDSKSILFENNEGKNLNFGN